MNRLQIVLIALKAILLAACASGAEKFAAPRPFVPPQEPVKFGLVAPIRQRMAAVPTVDPIFASAIIHVEGKTNTGNPMRILGSGTVINWDGESSTILTCEHLTRDLKDCEFVIEYKRRSYKAEFAKSDAKRDLMLLTCEHEFPAATIAEFDAVVGSEVVSIGGPDGYSVPNNHKVISFDGSEINTDGQQMSGRSGGGLFLDGKLIGVIKARAIDESRSLYEGLASIKRFIGVDFKYGSTAFYRPPEPEVIEVEFITAPFLCPGCNQSEESFAGKGRKWPKNTSVLTADGRLKITKRVGVGPWHDQKFVDKNPEAGYPFYRFEVAGKTLTYYSATSAEKLLETIETLRNGPPAPASVAADHDTHFAGTDELKAVLRTISDVCKVGSRIHWHWSRDSSAAVLLPVKVQQKETDVIGHSGRMDFDITGNDSLPVTSFHFNYRVDQDGYYIDPDGFKVKVDKTGIFSATGDKQKQGFGIVATYFVLSWGYTIWEALHPYFGFALPLEVDANCEVTDGGLNIDFGQHPPGIEADWHFLFNLVDVSYRRPFTGLILDQTHAVIQCHQSWVKKDIAIPYK